MKLIWVPLLVLFYAGFIAIFGWIPFHLLWNWLCPELFHLPHTTWGQSLGLVFLFELCFKGSRTSNRSKS